MRWTAFVGVVPRYAPRAIAHAGVMLFVTVLLVALPPAAAARVHALPAAASVPAARGTATSPAASGSEMPRIAVRGGRLYAGSAPFRAWGFGWGAGDHMPTLAYLDDPSAANYQTLASELQTAKSMGANSMRVFVELSEVMSGPTTVRQNTLTALQNLLSLAASDGIYLDITGDLVWRVNLSPDWYEQMSDDARWQVQSRFWHAVAHAAAGSPAVLCYELTSEPIISDTATRYFGQIGNWWFVQSMASGDGQDDAQLARSWTQTMALAVRAEDNRPVTIGMLPTLDGAFAPSNVAPYLDMLTVHDFPQTGQATAAIGLVNSFAGYGKPVLLGETGFLNDDLPTQQQFLLGVAPQVVGELEYFDGRDPRTMVVTTINDAIVQEGLGQFMALRPAILAGDSTAGPPPLTTITSGPWGATGSANATFRFASSESGATFECRLDGPGFTIGSFAPCTSPHTYSGLADGLYTFLVRSVDHSGNADPNPATHGFTVDTRAPAPPVIATPADGSYNTTGTVVLSGSAEPNSTVRITDGLLGTGSTTADSGGAWTKTLTFLGEGAHVFRATATDAANNTSAASAPTRITVDTRPPAPPVITSPADGSYNTTGTVVLSGSAEPNSTVRLYDGLTSMGSTTAGNGGAWTKTVTSLAEGTHAFRATATDAANRTSAVSAPTRITVNMHAPAPPVIASPADGTYNTTGAVVLVGSAEPSSTVSISDGVTAAGTTTADGGGNWTKTVTALTDGVHAFRASATDAANRASAPSGITHVTVDTHAPHTSIRTGPTGSTTQTSVSFEFTSSEPGSTFECALSGPGRPATFARCTSPAAFASLRPGSYVFAVRAVDHAGNTDPHPATRSFSIVATPSPPQRLTALSLTPSTLTPAASGPPLSNHAPTHGSVLKFTLARAGTVRFTVQKQALGQRTAGGHCMASRSVRRTRPCTFFGALRGGVVIAGKRGLNRWWFTGRINGNRLVNGSYKLVASPVGARSVEVRFRIQR